MEGLRALAALSVLLFHVWVGSTRDAPPSLPHLDHWIVDNLTGVTLFFALSGFLLYLPFASAIVRGGDRPNIRNYLHNRALRILPAYWVILVLIAVVLGAATQSGSFFDTGHVRPMVLFDDLLLIQNYRPATVDTGILPAWTLVVEIAFYVTMPMLAVAANWLAKGRRLSLRVLASLLPAALLLLIGLVAKVVAIHSTHAGNIPLQEWGRTWHAVLERSFFCSADLFTCGMVAAVVLALVEAKAGSHMRRIGRVSGFAAIGICLAAVVWHTRFFLDTMFYTTVVSLGCGFLILWAVLPGPQNLPRRLLEHPWAVWLGMVSYSVYLWHYPMIIWLREHHLTTGGRIGFFPNAVLVLAVVLGLSALTYRYVEAPAMRHKRRLWEGRRPEPVAAEASTTEAAP